MYNKFLDNLHRMMTDFQGNDVAKQRKQRKPMTADSMKTVMNMSNKGHKPSDIADSLDISLATVYRILAKISNTCNEVQGSVINFADLITKAGRKPSSNVVAEDRIREILCQDNTLTQNGVKEKLLTEGIKLSQSRICKLIKKIKFSRKRLKRVSDRVLSIDVIEERYNFCVRVNALANTDLMYLDETGFNLHSTNNYGYSPANVDAIRHVPANRGRNVSLLAMMSLHKFANFQLIDGAYNSESFLNFLKDSIAKQILGPGKYLIMDNAKIHHSRLVLEYLTETNIKVIFLPPYSPKLNPIEEGFSMVKANFHKIRPLSKVSADIKRNVENVLHSINSTNGDFSNFFSHMRSFVGLGINREPF